MQILQSFFYLIIFLLLNSSCVTVNTYDQKAEGYSLPLEEDPLFQNQICQIKDHKGKLIKKLPCPKALPFRNSSHSFCDSWLQKKESPTLHFPGKSHPMQLCLPIGNPNLAHKRVITILLFGDSGTGKKPQYQLGQTMYRACQQRECDFALMLGDNIYPDGTHHAFDSQYRTKFENAYEPFGRFDFWTILGNHDYRANTTSQIDYTWFSPRWRMPQRYYSIPHLPPWLHIFGSDTNTLIKKQDNTQIEEMKKRLCKNEGWKFIFGHHPMYSTGFRGSEPKLWKVMDPLIKKCQLHGLFSGHDHHQEHIKVKNFDQFIQGAAGKVPEWWRYALEFNVTQSRDFEEKYRLNDRGFAIMNITPYKYQIEFFNMEGKVIYKYERQSK